MWDAEPISKPLAVPPVREAVLPLFDRVHGWITTVDHKRLGIMYIVYALVFLVIGGIEATIMRIQLIRPHNDFVSPQVFNRMFTMHGTTMIFFVAMPDCVWLHQLRCSADDRRARHGLPAAERLGFLDDRVRRHHPVLQLFRRQRAVRRRQRSRRRLVRLRAADLAGVLAWDTAPTTGSSGC